MKKLILVPIFLVLFFGISLRFSISETYASCQNMCLIQFPIDTTTGIRNPGLQPCLDSCNSVVDTNVNVDAPTGVITSISKVISGAVQLIILVAGLIAFVYLLLGGIKWITSGGDKENLTKARSKITNALVGMFILVTVLVIWIFIMNTFGLMEISGKNIKFELPTINN